MRKSVWFLTMFMLAGCATGGGGASRAGVPKTVTIEFKARAGDSNETRYFSNARILTYEEGQLLRDRTEGVDFTVLTRVTGVDEKNKTFDVVSKTIAKDGASNLHDLAFPELKEEIAFTLRSNAQVVKAGKYPKESLFFVPAMPVPKKPVEIGDTWTMDHMWYSAKEGIPLRLEVVGILKDIVRCLDSDVCADIEISGRVGLGLEPTAEGARFDSRVWGRVLFAIGRGDVLWSEMRSSEEMGVKGNKMGVNSCMVSEVKLKGPAKIKFECDPNVKEVSKTPVF